MTICSKRFLIFMFANSRFCMSIDTHIPFFNLENDPHAVKKAERPFTRSFSFRICYGNLDLLSRIHRPDFRHCAAHRRQFSPLAACSNSWWQNCSLRRILNAMIYEFFWCIAANHTDLICKIRLFVLTKSGTSIMILLTVLDGQIRSYERPRSI